MTNETVFRNFMLTIGELYDREMSALLQNVYWKALEPYTDEQCERAFNTVLVKTKFFPKPAEIVQEIEGNIEDLATNAWLAVQKTVRRVGTYQSVKFDDPVIHSVIESMGGWIELGQIPEKEIKWKQKEFERLYQLISSNGSKHPSHLVGRFELENAGRFPEHTPKPVLVGRYTLPVKSLEADTNGGGGLNLWGNERIRNRDGPHAHN